MAYNWMSASISQGFGPTDEPLDSGYGGYAHFNKGIDYEVPYGTPIDSPVGGTVINAGDAGDGWGYSVKIRDANGNIWNYGHLSSYNFKVGDTVQPGQYIGESGGSRGDPGAGSSTGPHLSFDVQNSSGEWVEPLSQLGGSPQGGSELPTGDWLPDDKPAGTTWGAPQQSSDGRWFQVGSNGKVQYLPEGPKQSAPGAPTTIQGADGNHYQYNTSSGTWEPSPGLPTQQPAPAGTVPWRDPNTGIVYAVNPNDVTDVKAILSVPSEDGQTDEPPDLQWTKDGVAYQWDPSTKTWIHAPGIANPNHNVNGQSTNQAGGGYNVDPMAMLEAATKAAQQSQAQQQAHEIERIRLAAKLAAKEGDKNRAIQLQQMADQKEAENNRLRQSTARDYASVISTADPLGHATFLSNTGLGDITNTSGDTIDNSIAAGRTALTPEALMPAAIDYELLQDLAGNGAGGGSTAPPTGGGTMNPDGTPNIQGAIDRVLGMMGGRRGQKVRDNQQARSGMPPRDTPTNAPWQQAKPFTRTGPAPVPADTRGLVPPVAPGAATGGITPGTDAMNRDRPNEPDVLGPVASPGIDLTKVPKGGYYVVTDADLVGGGIDTARLDPSVGAFDSKGAKVSGALAPGHRLTKFADGGTTGAREMVIGDPQANMRPNPEHVRVMNPGPDTRLQITPLQDMNRQRAQRIMQGGMGGGRMQMTSQRPGIAPLVSRLRQTLAGGQGMPVGGGLPQPMTPRGGAMAPPGLPPGFSGGPHYGAPMPEPRSYAPGGPQPIEAPTRIDPATGLPYGYTPSQPGNKPPMAGLPSRGTEPIEPIRRFAYGTDPYSSITQPTGTTQPRTATARDAYGRPLPTTPAAGSPPAPAPGPTPTPPGGGASIPPGPTSPPPTTPPPAAPPPAPPAPANPPASPQPVTSTQGGPLVSPVGGGTGALPGMAPPDQATLDYIRQLREGTIVPNLNPYDVNFNQVDPLVRQAFMMARQSKYGVPVESQLWEEQKYRLNGVDQRASGY